MGYCTVQFPELPVHYMSPGLHQQVDCLLLPVWSLKYSLITETLKKFQPHIDAQNFNLILMHKVVSIFSQTYWDLPFWETIGLPYTPKKALILMTFWGCLRSLTAVGTFFENIVRINLIKAKVDCIFRVEKFYGFNMMLFYPQMSGYFTAQKNDNSLLKTHYLT